MQAIILAGGKGTRLRPYTMTIPKPLVPVGERAILDIIIRQLKHYKINEIIISTGYLAELIEAYFGDGKKWEVAIRYVREETPLGTAGAIKNIQGLDDDFIVMNGDVLTDINYKDLYDFHLKHEAIATIATIKKEILSDSGVLEMGADSKLISYTEKPTRFDYVSIGINVLSRRCQEYISVGEQIGIPQIVARMQAKEERLYCYKSNAYWLDIGKFEDFEKAQEILDNNKEKFIPE